MEEEKDFFKTSISNKEVVGTKEEILDFLKTQRTGNRIWIERVYTIEQFKKEEEKSLPF